MKKSINQPQNYFFPIKKRHPESKNFFLSDGKELLLYFFLRKFALFLNNIKKNLIIQWFFYNFTLNK
ncbi:hypothetical protein BN938_1323 [Mucinivorans hirudinis]|uniref:Uncharacterized protein n=1 Tax=Mucinivorans hirudinis TaxID=1433126 RepID=A0A060R7Y1_9BACT|nr:hypothetical protein BN938_1323 [Mucinivorans hirudinis]